MTGSEYERNADARTVGRRLGASLMVLGALFLGFVAFRLWGTGIEHARAQQDLRERFEQSIAATSSGQPQVDTTALAQVLEPTTTSIAPTTTARTKPATTMALIPAPTTAPTPGPATTAPPSTAPPSTAPPSTAPPSTAPPSTEPPPTVPPRPEAAEGDPVLRLEIPRIGLDEIVVSGVGVEDLKKGPGHYPQTPLPGELGNAAVAGHRTTYGAPFFRIDELAPGDEIVATSYAGRFVYLVTETVVVPPTEVGVIAATDDTRLTLTSCHPRYSAANRIVVTALLVPEQSAPLATVPPPPPPPTTAAPTTTAAPSTTTTTTPPTTVAALVPAPVATPPPTATARAPIASTSTSTSSTSTTAAATVPANPSTSLVDELGPGPGSGGSGAAPQGSTETLPELVSEPGIGWFRDLGALVDLALWATVCLAVVVAVRTTTRRVGHRAIGVLAGASPFAIALFFTYQNLNRLLPAGV